MSMESVFEFYERVSWRWVDTHPSLKKDEFYKVLQRTFRKSKVIEVAKKHRESIADRMSSVRRSSS